MPPKQYADRSATLYFPSKEYRNEWAEMAHAARMPLAKWIFSMVEAKLADTSNPRPDLWRELEADREELATLRRSVREKDAILEKYETELFNLRNREFQAYPAHGNGKWDRELIHLLRSGRVWKDRALLDAMGIDPKNYDAMTTLNRQLQAMQDMGLIVEDPMGWRWL